MKNPGEPGLSYLGPSGRKTGANRSWFQKVGQMSRVFQVPTTGRFEVEDFAKQIPGFSLGFSFCRWPLPGYQIKIDIIGAVGCAGLQFDGQTTVS
jgi:hypothetical protein